MAEKSLEEIIESAEKSAFVKNYKNLEALCWDGKLRIGGDTVKDESLKNFREFVQEVVEIYGDDWDLTVNVSSGILNISSIILHFPEFDITNSVGNSHEIVDFYLKLQLYLDGDTLQVGSFNGGRGSLTLKEYSCGYLHSHSRKVNPGKAPEGIVWSNFCTGSGEINKYREAYCVSNTSEKAMMLLLQIQTMVRWESLEGTPHFNMSSIRYVGSTASSGGLVPLFVTDTQCQSFSRIVLEFIRTGKLPVTGIKVSIVSGKILVDFEDIFIQTLLSLPELKPFVGCLYDGQVYTENSFIEYVKQQNSEVPYGVKYVEPIKNTGIYFNGKELSLNITDFTPGEKKDKIEIEKILQIPEKYVDKLKTATAEEIYNEQIRYTIACRYA